MSLAIWLWTIAYAGLLTAGFASRADTGGVLGVALGGHLLWAMLFMLERGREVRLPSRASPKRLVIGLLGLIGALETMAGAIALLAHDPVGALEFAIPTSFALAGIMASLRREPSDPVLAAQLFFHTVMLVPAAAIILYEVLHLSEGTPFAQAVANPMTLVKRVQGAVVVGLPLVMMAELTVFVIELSRPRRQFDRLWIALLVHQIALLVIVSRWILTQS